MLPYIDPKNVDLHRPVSEGPDMNMSALEQLDRALPIRGFAVKFVLQGVERYTLDGHLFAVKAGHYLLANATCESRVVIDSATPVKGLCVELTTDLMDEVSHALSNPEAIDQEPVRSFFTGNEFPENVHDAQSTLSGPLVKHLAMELFRLPAQQRRVNMEFYYALAEAIVRDHRSMEHRLRAVNAVRSSTRKDIFRRVQRAKAFMEEDLFLPMSVPEMAHEAAMSTYHFIRAFRSMERVTPYQYRTALRLDAAHGMLSRGDGNVQEVAERTGFADAPSFSKAFRRSYGHPPSALLSGSRKN